MEKKRFISNASWPSSPLFPKAVTTYGDVAKLAGSCAAPVGSVLSVSLKATPPPRHQVGYRRHNFANGRIYSVLTGITSEGVMVSGERANRLAALSLEH